MRETNHMHELLYLVIYRHSVKPEEGFDISFEVKRVWMSKQCS